MNATSNVEEAKKRYLRGADLAQQGEYDLAAAEMATALELDPSLLTTRFQLGLLQLTQGQPEKAIQTWAPLETQDSDEALKYFKRGLEALIRDDFAQCIQWLEKGALLNTVNAALNNDMMMVIGKAKAALKDASAQRTDKDNGRESGEVIHTDFSLYGKDN